MNGPILVSLQKRMCYDAPKEAVTKSVLDALSDGLWLEVQPYGVRVVSVGPLETKTEFHERASLLMVEKMR